MMWSSVDIAREEEKRLKEFETKKGAGNKKGE